MIIKKYVVSDVKEALIRAKYELGPDAVILHQKQIGEKKWYRPFSKDEYEVLVAKEEKNFEEVKENFSEEEEIEILVKNNPIFENASETIKKQLIGYCRLKLIDNYSLDLAHTVDFINNVYKDNPFDRKVGLKPINIFVGPTGVGKTTTIAKLAAKEHIENKKKVGLLTIDTYRIGAVEQLKTYSEILGTPFEVVRNPDEINEKIYRLKDCDVILIDTLGTSQMNGQKMADILKYIESIKMDLRVFLTVSISSSKDTMYSILDRYEMMNYDGVILTKFDEVVNYKNFWSLLDYGGKPVEYFCYGQDVPEDINKATLENIIEYKGVL